MRYSNLKTTNTSWQHVGKWYSALVGKEGHYYHKHVILLNVLRLLSLKPNTSILDLACGEGVLTRSLPKNIFYQGVDIANNLISFARKQDHDINHHYLTADITRVLPLAKKDFDRVIIILALQNIEFPRLVFANARKHLKSGGKLLIVLNHPYFRIPRQTSWEIDQKNKLQYRRINRYLSPLKIPISQHPGSFNRSTVTWSFHFPLSSYSEFLESEGFVISKIEEWISDKISLGEVAKMENRAREEFPLFMAILAQKME